MNVSGMNTTSEDKAFAIASPVASCQSHSYNRISCSPVRESTNQSKPVASLLNCHGLIDDFPFSLSGDSRETLLLRASIKGRLENHRPYSPASLDGESVCLIGSNENSTECVDAKSSDKCDSALSGAFKSPVVQEHCLLDNASESTSLSNTCLSPRHVSNCFTDSNHCNGSIIASSSVGALGCFTPPGDVQIDMNGRSGSQTPASVNDSERIKMDLNKLDETIDYVLSYARSDEPCEGMFVLPCRSREATQLASPNLRANTPSSGLLASPSSSPLPPSPQSYRVVSSPMLNQPNRTQSLVQASSVPCVVTSQSVPRYVVDQTSGLLHFPRSINPSGAAQGITQPTVSFVHVYSDTSSIIDVRTSEHSGSHIRQPINSTTQMILHPNVIHGFQNHVVAPQNAFTVPPTSVPPRTFNSLVSPTKLNLVHALPAHVSRVGTLSPTYTSFAHPSEASGLVTNRTVVFSPSNTVCVMQTPLLSPPPVYETPSNYSCDSQPPLNYSSFHTADKRACTVSSPVSFRQPVAPPQPQIAPGVQCGPFPASSERDSQVSVSLSPNQILRPSICNASSVKKRSHASSSSGAKRRKTAAATVISTPTVQPKTQLEPIIQPGKPSLQEYFEKLRSYDVRSLVSAPTLRPHTSVLLPTGGSDPPVHPLSDLDELELLKRRGLKYSRGSMSVQVPKIPHPKVEVEADSYIIQHLQTNTPLGPMVSPRKPHQANTFVQPVCPSPEPPSFENHMQALFSSMHRSPKQDEPTAVVDRPSVTQSHDLTILDPKLIPVFSEVSVGKPDPERCTPPLPLFHMPNPRLICQPICLGTGDRGLNDKAVRHHPTESVMKQDVPCSITSTTPSMSGINGISSVNSPLIDSETGEVVAGRRLSPQEQVVPSDTGAEKLHITFTISPSMTGGVPKIIRHIAELLGIDQNAVCYQVTRSGAQITLDQKQSHSESVMRNLENQLRQHFTPLSLHVEKATNPSDEVCFTGVQSDSDFCSISPTSNLGKCGISESSTVPNVKDSLPSKPTESARYAEEPVSIPSLLTSKRTVVKPCQNCDKPVPPHTGQRKCLEEIAALSGLSSRSDVNGDFVFCSGECLAQFSRLVSNRHMTVDEIGTIGRPADELSTTHCTESRQPTLACDFSASIPVLLQCGLAKSGKISKRTQPPAVAILGPGSKKRGPGAFSSSAKSKRWRGSRWRVFSSHLLPQCNKLQTNSLCNEDVLLLLKDHPSRRRLPVSDDHRVCLLCSVKGDAPEDGLGRLLPFDIDKWLHINCALWCFEVYETVGGSLNNVHIWLKKALETNCTHCGNFGAGLPCYNPRCTSVYHVSCAVELKCMFFTDRGMYCPQHQPKEQHPMQLLSLAVNRRVYIARDENNQVGDVIHEEDRSNVVRIGTVYLQSVGQLLPHQIESGLFHARRYIYPVGFRSTRIYWSTRKPRCRGRYVCEILESEGKPLFKVTVIDEGLEDEVFTDETCGGVWNSVLSKIELLREQDKLVRLFPEHLKGEDMYGLSEPHIVRAVESLPGVECLRDYVFHFGRMELIAEMPLAINPSGCARCEPKMQTYVKRSNSRGGRPDSVANGTACFPGPRRSVYPALTPVSAEFSKQYQSSRSQQYRRLKSEVGSNVILGRSRIQGLGLFAARDLEPQTMVIEYIGELIRSELANKREKTYEAHNRGIYMFRLDEDTVIDATVCGGLARYINHSCQPNCYAEFLTLGDHSHIVIITNRNIDKGEELCYDYNFDLEDRGSKIPCLCRAPNCRKWMN